MEKELVIAVGSSLVSLLVALLALWQSGRATKKQAATQKAIVSLQAGSEAAKPVLASISEAWTEIQRIKHALDLLAASGKNDYSSALAILDSAADELVARYEQHGAELPKYIREVWHDAKNYGLSVRAGVRLQLRDLSSNSTLLSAVQTWIEDARGRLTVMQAGIEEGRERYRRDAIDGVTMLLQQAESRASGAKGCHSSLTLSVSFVATSYFVRLTGLGRQRAVVFFESSRSAAQFGHILNRFRYDRF